VFFFFIMYQVHSDYVNSARIHVSSQTTGLQFMSYDHLVKW